jgi:glycosyltransferase involved in cell wall biosynthesis
MSSPVLAVCLITYNHGRYIHQAIESILMQQVNFSWELIIADDCSTDDTRKVLKDYKEKHPDFIHLILQSRNVGPAQNWMDLVTYSKAKYIAYLEGDDYWADPLKLQKQVDFLESNPSFSMCFHNVDVVNGEDDTFVRSLIEEKNQRNRSSYELVRGCLIHPNSVVYRNTITFPPETIKAINGDTFLFALLAEHGDAGFINDIKPSIYRVHQGGIWSAKSLLRRNKDALDSLNLIKRNVSNKFSKVINLRILRIYKQILRNSLREKKYSDFALYGLKAMQFFVRSGIWSMVGSKI